ncbi:hypothetical protein ACHAWF_012288, partial [Thalassiosira exigua]
CYKCGDKFENYDAEEYARGNGWDSEAEDSDDDVPPPDYDTCPGCLDQEERREAEKELAKSRETELAVLRKEVKELRTKLAAVSATAKSEPAAKRSKVSGKVWVIIKGDWPCEQNAQLVDVKVLGTYSSLGWQEGYGYHQGESESNIQIVSKLIDAPAE